MNDGAAISMHPSSTLRERLSATGPTADLPEDPQFSLGEGACLDAPRTGRPVLTADMCGAAETSRWPVYTDAVVERAGVGAVFAFPLQRGPARPVAPAPSAFRGTRIHGPGWDVDGRRACMDGSQGSAGTAVILLVDVLSEVERGLVKEWMGRAEPDPVAVRPIHGPGLGQLLAESGPDTVVTAVRVAWRPRERNGQRRVRWSDVASLTNPRHPPARAQARIARREPDRAAVVVAEPATVAELQRRHAGQGSGAGSFGGFVVGQATLALERAERALVGDRYLVPKQIVEAIDGSPEFRREVRDLAARLELPEAEVVERATADLHGLVASMNPMAVDLLSGALRPLHSRAWNVQVDVAGLEQQR